VLATYLICLIVGGVFVGLSALGGGDDHDGHLEHNDTGEHGGESMTHTLAEGALAGRPHRWMPFASLRFWTFGSFFFGLGGLALTKLAELSEPLAAIIALVIGVVGGTSTAFIVHKLARPIGAPPDPSHWVGHVAELMLPLAPGAHSKVRLTGAQSERDMVVALADRDARALPKGTRVVILRIDGAGLGLVVPEAAIFGGRAAATSLARESQKVIEEEEES